MSGVVSPPFPFRKQTSISELQPQTNLKRKLDQSKRRTINPNSQVKAIHLMELSEDLRRLIDRAVELQNRIGDEIAGALSYYCRVCSEHGRYCSVAGAEAYEDRERLTEIRDSLKDLETMLVYLQRMRSWQLVNWNSALVRLEESRLNLIEKTNQYSRRPLEVMQEVNECFGNGAIGFRTNKAKEDAAAPARMRKGRVLGFMMSCIGRLFNPWRWHETAGIAVRMVLIAVSVSSTVSAIHGRQRSSVSRRRVVSLVGSDKDRRTLDVVHGRG